MRYFLGVFLVLIIFLSFNLKLINSQSTTVTPTPISIDPDTIIKNLQGQIDCGTIGLACCKPVQVPTLRVGYLDIPLVKYVFNPLIDFLNRILSVGDSLINSASSFIQTYIRGDRLCAEGKPSNKSDLNNCSCLPNETFNLALLCTNIGNPAEKTECINCSKNGIWTAIGCVDFKLETFVKETVFGLGIGLAGIIALLCIIYAAFQIQTSSGNPERIKKAQELLTSCIMGLMLIIFSVFILRVIGVDILKISGFGR